MYQTVLGLWRGVALAMLIATAAIFVSQQYGGPVLLFALFFGLAFHFLSSEPSLTAGLEFAAKTLLRIGVALLGARITFGEIAEIGVAPLIAVVFAVASVILLGTWFARWLRLPGDFGLLSGGAVGICGASAALAISAVMPRTVNSERDTAVVVVGVATLSTLAMILYPLWTKLLGLPDPLAGLFFGASIHDVAQVVGAGLIISPTAAEVATVVKLFRVALLAPAVLCLSLYWRSVKSRYSTDKTRPHLLPTFLVAFVLLVAINSAGLIPGELSTSLGSLSRYLLVVAIAALGIRTSFADLRVVGWRPVALMIAQTAWLAFLFTLCVLLLK